MSSESFGPSVLVVGAILAVAIAACWAITSMLFPGDRDWKLERAGWSIGVALFLFEFHTVVAFALKLRPGWISFGVVVCLGLAATRAVAVSSRDRPTRNEAGPKAVLVVLLALTAAGVLIYGIRSLSEPMWSNDFLAVWGLKGRTIYGDAGIPQRLFRWPQFEFSNPGYPIGLPLMYAGLAFLLGRWDDHAMALVFPLLQVGTLLIVLGWLRRRGVPTVIALAASALIANFGSLYSAWLTGMAEVPAAYGFLQVGTALSDAIEDTDRGCRRRLFFACLLAATTKNEGLFFLGTAFVMVLLHLARRREQRLWATGAAILVPGLGSWLLHRLVLGRHSLRAFDFTLLGRRGFVGRVIESVHEEASQLVRPAWPAFGALVLLIALARRDATSDRILVLVASSLATYLILPAFCTFGPGWLVHWSVGRIAAALFPLLVAGIALGWREQRWFKDRLSAGSPDGRPS